LGASVVVGITPGGGIVSDTARLVSRIELEAPAFAKAALILKGQPLVAAAKKRRTNSLVR
jgi:hypothetical protein